MKENEKCISVYLDIETDRALRQLAAEKGISKTRAAESIIVERLTGIGLLLTEEEKKNEMATV